MSHEINLIALNLIFEGENTVISNSVSPVSGKLGLAQVLHTLNTSDLLLMDQHQYLLQHCIDRFFFLCHYYALGPLSKNFIDM